MSEQRNYRSILPITPETVAAGQSKRDKDSPPEADPSSTKKRRSVAVACNTCRAKKLACDAKRPTCTRCQKAGHSFCEYISIDENETRAMAQKREILALRENIELHNNLIHRLRTAPEIEAHSMLRAMRSSGDLAAFESSVLSPVIDAHSSATSSTPHGSVESQLSVENELSTLHKSVYPSLQPDPTDGSVQQLIDLATFKLLPSNAYGQPPPSYYEPGPENLVPRDTIDPNLIDAQRDSITLQPGRDDMAQMLGPYRNGSFCDRRLYQLSVSFWTVVPVSNAFAAGAISFYLETDHGINGFFDADQLVQDLVEHRIDHCSAFLVSSLLCLASLGYAGFDSRGQELSTAFLQEAIDLWHSERLSKTTATITGLNLLSTAASHMGKNQLALEAIAHARRLSEDMELFGIQHTDKQDAAFRKLSTSKLRATAHVAWGTYCWHTLHAFFFHEQPILFPPSLPVPGDIDEDETTTSRLPWPGASLPVYMGHTFKALCELFCIVQSIMIVYFGQRSGTQQPKTSLAFAESKYQALLQWSYALHMEQVSESPLHDLIFRTVFHSIVVDLFRPFVQDVGKSKVRMQSFASIDSSPRTIYDLSVRQLQQVILEYSLNHKPDYYSHFFNAANIIVVNSILQNKEDTDRRFWLLLICRYWREMIIKCPVLAQIARASLAYAMNQECISSREAKLLMEQIEEHLPQHDGEILTGAIFDFHEALFATEGFTTDELAQQYEELTLFGDLVQEE